MPQCTSSHIALGLLNRTVCRVVRRAMQQVIYSRNGVKITSTPVEHYTTGGPSALRVDWNGLSFVYSGGRPPPVFAPAFCSTSTPVANQHVCWVHISFVQQALVTLRGNKPSARHPSPVTVWYITEFAGNGLHSLQFLSDGN